MNNLLHLALDAHGGIHQWKRFQKVTVNMMVSGILWHLKGQDGILRNSGIEVELHKQRAKYIDFENKAGLETYFDPGRVAIVDSEHLVQELLNPRDSFKGHKIETAWSKLQLVYFGSYAMWEYLTIPFSFTLPGFQCKEIEPWHEGNETWRRLEVIFPDYLAYHSKEQLFYFDETGLLKRMDYNVEISGGTAAAQYVFDYREFQGIKLPMRRLIYQRDEQLQPIPEPLIVGIELSHVQFE
jgi:hypothetical protein